ncbi:uncharacterized protein DS421_13g392470 [Arachis hypogaea]|nr:uncharacterized protein DS421_13g392470 [Arachis hypogaea]
MASQSSRASRFRLVAKELLCGLVRGQFCKLHPRKITRDEDFGVAYTMRFKMAEISSNGQIRNLEVLSKRLKLQEIGGR